MYATSQTPPAERSHIFSTLTVARANEMTNNLPKRVRYEVIAGVRRREVFEQEKNNV